VLLILLSIKTALTGEKWGGFFVWEFKAHPPAFQAAPLKGGETRKKQSGFLIFSPL
jgi:hypothetical protein